MIPTGDLLLLGNESRLPTLSLLNCASGDALGAHMSEARSATNEREYTLSALLVNYPRLTACRACEPVGLSPI